MDIQNISGFVYTHFFFIAALFYRDNEAKKYDLILTSETIYNVDNQAKLIAIFKHCLKRDGGARVLVAAKSVYFGVGGGLQEFCRRMEAEGFALETVYKSESGVSRHILAAVFK
jgi:hypothetical protein